MRTAVVLFTRDLRVRDNPALATACANAERVVPLFVFDDKLRGISANRLRFLHQAVADLRATFRGLGGDLVVRTGDPVAETMAVARQVNAEGVAMAADVSTYARARERPLRRRVRAAPDVVPAFPGPHRGQPG